MANSILNGQTPGNNGATLPPNFIQQFNAFRSSFYGNPQQIVTQMVREGKISQAQVDQAMNMAKKLSTMLR